MVSIADQDRKLGQRPPLSDEPTAALIPDAPTTPAERFLLFVTVIIYPLENQFPVMPNVSIMFLMFAVIAGYVAINRLWCLDRVWMHPVFVAGYLFIGISVALEFSSPLSRYGQSVSYALMISGALLVASLCRDRAALKMIMYAYIVAGLWLGAVLALTSYGTLSGVTATEFSGASQARGQAFRDSPIEGNLNSLALHCVQGGVVALAFALGSVAVRRQSFFAAIGIFCLVASSLPMSRGAIVNALVSSGALLKAYGIRQGKTWLLVGVLVAGAVLLVPNAIWLRMGVMTAGDHKDPRVILYESAIQNVDNYWFSGVGSGNYFQKWGIEKGFALLHRTKGTYHVYGVHNSFVQVMINWGLIGLLPYVGVFWLASRCLPRIYSNDSLALGILGIAVSLFMVMPFMSEFHYKGLSIGLGILVAYQRWLAPGNAAQPVGR